MDFTWTPQQKALWEDICQFARTELPTDDLAQRERSGTYPEAYWQRCARKGLFGLAIPQAYGGSGYDSVTSVHVLEAFGYGCADNGFTLSVNGQTWSVAMPIVNFGSEAQKERYLPRLADGTLKGAHAVTEPEAGSDVFSLTTTATRTEGGYLLNGRKMFIGMGPVADVFVMFATTNPQVGRWGVTAFIVDAESSGLHQEAPRDKMGLRTEPMGDVVFENVFVTQENRLGPEGAGASIFNKAMIYERSFIFASHIGSMARQLDQTIAYVTTRQQGGQPIGKYQSVSNRIADMKVRLETARAFLYKAAWMVDQGEDATLQSAMTKLVLSELFVANSLDAVRSYGGRGYLGEVGIERDLRDAIGGILYAGTSDIQRNLIAGLLGL